MNCVRLMPSVCGWAPIAKAPWGTAHLLAGSYFLSSAVHPPSLNSAMCLLPLFFFCLKHWCFLSDWGSYRAVWTRPASICCVWYFRCDVNFHHSSQVNLFLCFFVFSTESFADKTEQQGHAAKPERYGTTVPLLLKGKDSEPLSHLTPGVNTHKAIQKHQPNA